MKTLKEIEKEFDEKFKCIQDGCMGGYSIGSDREGEPEQQQCQFCFEYLYPIKSFISTSLRELLEQVIPEEERSMKYRGDYENDIAQENWDDCRSNVKERIKKILE